MKYIKIFENIDYDIRKVWLIRTSMPYLEISIDKIGLTKEQKQYLLTNKYVTGKEKYYDSWSGKTVIIKKIYIIEASEKEKKKYPSIVNWSPFQDGLEKLRNFNNIDYQGEIKVTKQDLKEWEIKNAAKKYNI